MEWPVDTSGPWDGYFFLLHRKYRYADRTIVDLDGISLNGASVRISVRDFDSRFYFRFDTSSPELDIFRAETILEEVDLAILEWIRDDEEFSNSGSSYLSYVLGYKPSLILSSNLVVCGDNDSYFPDDQFQFLEVKVCHPKVVSFFSNFLANPYGRSANDEKWSFPVPRWCDRNDFPTDILLYDSNVEFDVVFESRSKIGTCRWYHMDPLIFTPKYRRYTKCNFEFEPVYWGQMIKSDIVSQPLIKSFSLDIETKNNSGRDFPDPKIHPIIQICGFAHITSLKFAKSIAWTLLDVEPNIVALDYDRTGFSDERAMLSDFGDFIQAADPDFIGGHYITGFDLRYLLKRAKHLCLTDFASKFSRVFSQKPWMRKEEVKHRMRYTVTCPGRLVFDTMDYRRNLPDPYDCSLKACALDTLKHNTKIDLPHETINTKQKTTHGRTTLLRYCLKDAELVMRLAEAWNMELTIFSWGRIGIPPIKFLTKEMTARVECALMEAFGRLNKVYPDRKFKRKRMELEIPRSPSGKPIQGAITIEHEIGYYTSDFPVHLRFLATYVICRVIICLDFASLYPSLIMHFNIGTDTVGHRKEFEALGLIYGKDFDYIPTFGKDPHPDAPCFLKKHIKESVISEVELKLKNYRRSVKAEMRKEQDLISVGKGSVTHLAELDALQQAIKGVMNTLYGLHATETSRFCNFAVGSSITAGGRYKLLFSQERIRDKWGYPTVAGDTDSLMLAINEDEDGDAAMTAISGYLNPLLGDHLDFAPEKRFISAVFSGAKKHYYVLMAMYGEPDEKAFIKIKGCTFYKKKTCAFIRDACMKAVEIVLRGPAETRLQDLINCFKDSILRLVNGEVMIHELVEQQKLSRSLDLYSVISPAVAVAKREWGKACKEAKKNDSPDPIMPGAGRIINWIICADPASKNKSPKARPPEEVDEKNLIPDVSHYRQSLIRQFASYFAVPYIALSGGNPNPPHLKNMPSTTKLQKTKKWAAQLKYYESSITSLLSTIPVGTMRTYGKTVGTMDGFVRKFRKVELTRAEKKEYEKDKKNIRKWYMKSKGIDNNNDINIKENCAVIAAWKLEKVKKEQQDIEKRYDTAMKNCISCANDIEDIEICTAWRCENLGARKYCKKRMDLF